MSDVLMFVLLVLYAFTGVMTAFRFMEVTAKDIWDFIWSSSVFIFCVVTWPIGIVIEWGNE